MNRTSPAARIASSTRRLSRTRGIGVLIHAMTNASLVVYTGTAAVARIDSSTRRISGARGIGVLMNAMSNASAIVCIGTDVVAFPFVVLSTAWYSAWRTRLVISTGPDRTRDATTIRAPIVAGRAAR